MIKEKLTMKSRIAASEKYVQDLWPQSEGYGNALAAMEDFLDGGTFRNAAPGKLWHLRDITDFSAGDWIRLHYRTESEFKSHDGKESYITLSITFCITKEMKHAASEED